MVSLARHTSIAAQICPKTFGGRCTCLYEFVDDGSESNGSAHVFYTPLKYIQLLVLTDYIVHQKRACILLIHLFYVLGLVYPFPAKKESVTSSVNWDIPFIVEPHPYIVRNLF